MTYGWAILVALVVLGALIYFGVFSIKNPEFCQMSPGMLCTKSYLSANNSRLSLTLYNSFSQDMTIVAISCTKRADAAQTCTAERCGANYPPGVVIRKGNSNTFNITCEDESGDLTFIAGEGYGGGINVRYYFGNDASSVRIVNGRLYAIAN